MRLGVMGPDFDCSPVAMYRLVEPSLGIEGVGQIIQRAGVVRPEFQDAARAGRGVVDPFQPPIRHAEVQPGVRVRGPEDCGPLIGGGGLDGVALPEGAITRLEPASGPFRRWTARMIPLRTAARR